MTEQDKRQLGTILWAIADQLRGAMNADDFRVVNDNYTSPSTTITLPQTGTRRNYRSGALETRFCACFPDILSA